LSDYIEIYQSSNQARIASLANDSYFLLYANQYILFNTAADLAAGNTYAFESDNNIELTDTDAEQSWLYVEPKINQSATAGYNGLKIKVTETALGDGSTGTGATNNLIVAGTSANADMFKVTNTGNVVAEGTANVIPQYKTIFIPAASMTPTSTNGALPGTTDYVTNDINKDYLAFDATTEQYADVSFPMPEGWNRSTVKVKFYWTTESGSSATDTVEWEIAGVAVSDDDAIDTSLGTAQVISDAVLADNGTDLQLSGATPALTVGGTPALGDLVHWKVSRNVSGTDSCEEDAHLFAFVIQYLDNQAVSAW
jgi:hypothetical protein